ncbi:uncharacterized protein BYT42DRAFT_110841 [Radiomyces spectabilis]|uniref:uncharacterized protein n=1 Tax=Radiomyces spectabilis TaxID=64574 RepID=UPI00221F275C|nr:uncharacterized protein BYT42DRAFT_110841 [Radiomyces spectabilis]KAI8369446.1 hypothetical protein BYT42DRAFT_110841 [Radiomyces spectabilis]
MASTVYGSAYVPRSRTIEVPLQHEQVLEVVCNDLPSNSTELTDIFRQEGVPLAYYRMLALEYYEQDKVEQSIVVIQAGLSTASHSPHTQPRQKLPLLTFMATLHMKLAKKATDEAQRQKHLNDATQFINEADRIHNQYEQTFVVKGHLYLLRRDINEAIRSFNMVLDKRPNCIPALLGKAKIQYHLRQYKQSLKTYQTALIYSRGRFSPLEIRFGIAQCFSRLGMDEEAKAALKRCIEVSEKPNAAVLALLAIIELNQSKKPDQGLVQQENALRHGLQHMQQAHRADKKQPVVLNMLANHFFLTRDFEKTMKSASKALVTATNDNIKAEASYQIARAHHQMQQYDDAFKFYRQALELNPDHILAQFGIGQMHLCRGELDVTAQIFEKLHETEPQCIEVIKILGSLYTATGRQTQALNLFNKVLEHYDDDQFLDIEVAQLYEEKDQTRALKYYQASLDKFNQMEAEEAQKPENLAIKSELLNNVAAVHHTLGNLDEAETYYSLAIQEFDRLGESSQDNKNVDVNLKITTTYNLARLFEDRLETEKATSIYKKLTEDYPSYADAHLRLGAIEQFRGRATEAQEYYKEVFDSDPIDAKAWIMIGQAQATINEKLCKRSFEKVLKDCEKNDLYTHIALGNYHAAAAREMKSEKLQKQRQEAYKLAVGFFAQALRRDPMNSYAANGLAITLADNGHIDQARDLFTQVRESSVNNSCVWINLAHTFVELKHYKQAIVMYENASKRFFANRDANILLCLARAQFIMSKSTKEPEIMLESLRNTEKAFHLNPSDKSTLHNIALVQQSYAQLISDLSKDQRTSVDLRRAIKSLDTSQRIFKMLIDVPESEFVLYERGITKQRARYGETLRTQLERKMTEQLQFEEDKQHKYEEVRKKREEEAARLEAEASKKRQAEEEERQRMEEERRRLMERVREENLRMASMEVDEEPIVPEKKSRKRTKKQKELEDDEEEENEVEEPEERAGRSRKQFRSSRIIEDSDEE